MLYAPPSTLVLANHCSVWVGGLGFKQRRTYFVVFNVGLVFCGLNTGIFVCFNVVYE